MAIINKKQFRIFLIFQCILLSFCILIGTGFWGLFCRFDLDQCISWESSWSPIMFLVLATLRPILFTPTFILATLAAKTFSWELALFITAGGAALSSLLPYFLGKYLGANGVRSWLTSNLPATWQMLKTHDYKIIFLARWLMIFPFDLFSIFYGMLSFKLHRVIVMSFLGVLPESYFVIRLLSHSDHKSIFDSIGNITIFTAIVFLPLIVYEFISRHKGSSLWTMIKRTYYEIIYEVQSNNHVIRRREFDGEKPTVILLYGFFSSRKALVIMEKLLIQRGFQVMSFNLGGLLGVFFTRGIKETAEYIDQKIQRQVAKHGFKKIYIVGHSKGGLVGLWLLLKLEGYKYCKKIITLGTPFNGSYLTYLGLFTPLGLLWRDLWQMRPGSNFFQELNDCQIPENLKIYCISSDKDKVTGKHGYFKPDKDERCVENIELKNIGHFEFLYKKEVADTIARLLRRHIRKDV